MSLADELHKIIREEAQDKAVEARRIDALFPQPEPHVFILNERPEPEVASTVVNDFSLKM